MILTNYFNHINNGFGKGMAIFFVKSYYKIITDGGDHSFPWWMVKHVEGESSFKGGVFLLGLQLRGGFLPLILWKGGIFVWSIGVVCANAARNLWTTYLFIALRCLVYALWFSFCLVFLGWYLSIWWSC